MQPVGQAVHVRVTVLAKAIEGHVSWHSPVERYPKKGKGHVLKHTPDCL